MNFSAASSSSLVVTPGRALERSIRRQRAWIFPASAIASICSEVLRMIMPRYTGESLSYLHLLLATEGGEQGVDALLDLIGWTLSGQAVEDATLLVIGDQRLGLLAVLREAVLDHLGLVVVADDQPGAVEVADALLLRRVELDVVDVGRVLLAGATTSQPAHDLLLGDVDQDGRRDLPVQLDHPGVEGLGLRPGAGETVEDEAISRLIPLQALGDHADDHLVGDEVAPVHVLLRLLAHLGPLLDRGAQDVAGGVVRQPEVLLQALALGSLAAAGRAQEDQVQLGQARHPAARITSGSPRSCASSAGPRAASRCRGRRRRRSGSRYRRRRSSPTSD